MVTKEQLLIDREILKLQQTYEGVTNLKVLPDAVFIIDAVSENTALQECKRMGIKVVAIADTNCNPNCAAKPILDIIKTYSDPTSWVFYGTIGSFGLTEADEIIKISKTEFDSDITNPIFQVGLQGSAEVRGPDSRYVISVSSADGNQKLNTTDYIGQHSVTIKSMQFIGQSSGTVRNVLGLPVTIKS